MSNYTADQIRRIHDAIAECDKHIAREMAYRAQFRNTQSISEYEQHKAKLIAMLEAA